MNPVLLTWIGAADRNAPDSQNPDDIGPVARALSHAKKVLGFEFARVHLIDDRDDDKSRAYEDWLSRQTASEVSRHTIDKPTNWSPGNYTAVWLAVESLLRELAGEPASHRHERYYLCNAGTSAMSNLWLLISRMQAYRGVLLQSSKEKGLERAELPPAFRFDYASDPSLLERADFQRAMEGKLEQGFIAESQVMQNLVRFARKVASTNCPVLILGPTGSGKEELARLIHRESPRHAEPFLPINCGAIPAELLESELFGYQKGGHSTANKDKPGLLVQAGGGTVLLDEIGDLPLLQQVKLLRALQQSEVYPLGSLKATPIRCRFLAATHKNLMVEVDEGRFREDLYYRISAGVILDLPPLYDPSGDPARDRRADVLKLTEHLWTSIRRDYPELAALELGQDALDALMAHEWPGNVRELAAALTRAAFMADGPTIRRPDIQAALVRRRQSNTGATGGPVALKEGFELDAYLREVESGLIQRALKQAGGNKAEAGRLLGHEDRTWIGKKMKALNIE